MLSEAERAHVIPHEAGHAIGFLWAGHRIEAIWIDDRQEDELGVTQIDFSDGPNPTVRFLVGQLMGPMASGGAPPAWKPKYTGKGDDESAIAVMIDHLDLDEAAYDKTVKIARELLEAPDVKAAHALLCHALERVPAMTGRQVEELLGPHLDRIRPEGVADAS